MSNSLMKQIRSNNLMAKQIVSKKKQDESGNKIIEQKKIQKLFQKIKNNEPLSPNLDEIENINVSKNLQELAQMLIDMLNSYENRILLLRIISKIYQLNQEFPEILFKKIFQIIKENNEFDARKNYVFIMFDLHLSGLIQDCEKLSTFVDYLLNQNPLIISNIVLQIIKNYSYEYFSGEQKNSFIEDPQELMDVEQQTNFRKKFLQFIQKFAEVIDRLFSNIESLESTINTILRSKGTLSLENEFQYQETSYNYVKSLKIFKEIKKYMKHEINFSHKIDQDIHRVSTNIEVIVEEDQQRPLFESEEEKSIYRELMDLKSQVPEHIFKKKGNKDKNEKTVPDDIFEEIDLQLKRDYDIPNDYQQFSEKLFGCVYKQMSDRLACEFCYLGSNKAHRQKLVKELLEYRTDYQVSLPYLCRLVANLNPHFKDIAEMMVTQLQEDFDKFRVVSSSNQNEQDRKIRIVRYIAEFTKFQICDHEIIIEVLKKLLRDFNLSNLEVVLEILEHYGFYFYNSKEISPQFKILLEILKNQRNTKNIPHELEVQVQNTIFRLQPKRNFIKKKKEKSDLQKYITYLLFDKIQGYDTCKTVAYDLLNLPWDTCLDTVVKQFIQIVRKGKFQQIEIAAALLAFLSKDVPELHLQITDYVLDQIMIGLSTNEFNDRQLRISNIYFFGQLYVFNLIDDNLLQFVLNLVIEYGNMGTDKGNLDPEDDPFRISLICTLLDTVKQYLRQRKMKEFTMFYMSKFQRYFLSKTYLPVIQEFMVLDLFEYLAPDIKHCKTVEEADKILKIQQGSQKNVISEEIQPQKPKQIQQKEKIPQRNSQEQKQNQDVQAQIQLQLEREIQKKAKQQQEQLDDDFEREFQSLINDSVKENKNTSVIPIHQIQQKKKGNTGVAPGGIKLLYRQNNKQQQKTLNIGEQTNLAEKIQKRENLMADIQQQAQNKTMEMQNQVQMRFTSRNTDENEELKRQIFYLQRVFRAKKIK